MNKYLLVLLCFWLYYPTNAQLVIDRKIPAMDIQYLVVHNFNGDIKVEKHHKPQIDVRAELMNDQYSKEIKWEFKQGDTYVLFYLESPCTESKSEFDFDPQKPSSVFVWKENCNWEPHIEDPFPHLNYTIRIPEYVSVILHTVMKGDIRVTGPCAQISANNVNGGIYITEAKEVIEAKTINDDISISFATQPATDGMYSTINGNIEINMVNNPNLNISFKSMMGDFYTDYKSLKVLPDEVIRTVAQGTEVIVQESTRMEIGKNGPKFTLETLNGDVFLKNKN